MRGKKAQITLFIILGIVLIGAGATLYRVLSMEVAEPLEEEKKPAVEVAYAGSQELREYVESCLMPIVLEGIEIIRLQGGYIFLPQNIPTLPVIDHDDRRAVKSDPVTGTLRVVSSPNTPNKVAFWLTDTELKVPSLDIIENELKMYVDIELAKCAGNFEPFVEQGFSVETGVINSTVEMETVVVVNADFPVTIIKEGVELRNRDFIYEVPINMKLIHSIANRTAGYEPDFMYLEKFTKDQIVRYGWHGGGKERYLNSLPPISFAAAGFECEYESWSMGDVEEKIKDILNANFKFFKVNRTNFTREIRNNPLEQGALDSYIHNFFDSDFPTIRIGFSYEQPWDFYEFDIKPRSGKKVKPDRHSTGSIPLMPVFCTFRYDFKYTMQYPVLVRVTDASSAKIDPIGNVYEEKGGFVFQFPLWVVLFGNQERKYVPRGYPRTADDLGLSDLDLEALERSATTIFCEPEHWISDDVTVKTFDDVTGELLPKVDIYYKCGSAQNNCFIERTEENGAATAKFPLCENGIVYTSKVNYSEGKTVFTARTGDGATKVDLFPEPYRNLKVKVRTIHVPTFTKNYHETSNFTVTERMIKLGYDYRYDMGKIEGDAAGLGLNITKAPLILLTARSDPPSYCESIEELASNMGILPSYGEPGDPQPCSVGSYNKTEGVIVGNILKKMVELDSYKAFVKAGMDSFFLGLKDVDVDDITKSILINLGGTTPLSFLYQQKDTISFPSGFYKVNSRMTEEIKVRETRYGSYELSGGGGEYILDGPYITGFADYNFTIAQDKLHQSRNITFYMPVNYYPEEINDMTDLDDPIMTPEENGMLTAEIIYRFKTIGYKTAPFGLKKPICSDIEYEFIAIDGVNSDYDPFEGVNCAVVEYAEIPKEEYSIYLMPRVD